MTPPALGVVDIHSHGGLGAEFGQSEAGSRRAAAYHRDNGTVSVVASLVSAGPDDLATQVATLAPLVADGTLAGIHLEGPFLAMARRGAHDPALLRQPDPALVARLVQVCDDAGAPGALRQWTFAPELDGSAAFARELARHGVLPAVGHTDGTALEVAQTLALVADLTGRAPLVTHVFNGMPAMHHRSGGPAAAALAAAARGEAVVELIADGLHVAPEMVRLVFDAVGADQIVLVSDAMSATGLGDGSFTLGRLAVTVTDAVARLTDGGSIAGSTRTLGECVRWAIDVAGVSEHDATRSATVTPRRVLDLA